MEGEHDTMTAGEATLTRAGDATFLGHPKGLFYLAFTEAWERFSFYGMTALVVLYMVNQLLLPGHVEHIGGFSGFRAAVESLVGPLSTQALASQIFGLYSGFVYFTPLLGGLIADRWIGQRNGVVIGALSMSAGHIAMTFDQSFLVALLLLVIGSGFLKGNISAQVGALYPPEDEARRTRGFVIFSTGINIGAVVGPHSPRPCHLSLRIPVPAGAGGAAQVRGHSAHRSRPAHRLRAHRRDDNHNLPVNVLLSTLQRESDLDSTACRARPWRLPAPGPLVPIDQFGFQHPGRAAGVLDLASSGIAASRAGRSSKDRYRSLDRRCEQPDPGGRNLRFGRRACSPHLAIPL